MADILLKIRPSKTKEDDRSPRRGPLLMEQVLATMHALRSPVCLEIGNHNGRICFFARCSEEDAGTVESQIYGQYPDAAVERIPLSTFSPQQEEQVHTVYLALEYAEIFPIKRHPQFDDFINRISVDPLSGITSTLSHFADPAMRAHIKICIEPDDTWFYRRALRFLPLLNKGLAAKYEWYCELFCNVHLARGWKRLLLLPIDIVMGGFRSWFQSASDIVSPITGASVLHRSDEEDVRVSSRSHDREDDIQGAQDKLNKLLFFTSIQLRVIAPRNQEQAAKTKLREITGSFKQLELPQSNNFRTFRKKRTFRLSHEELATLWHLPTLLVQTPGIDWVTSKQLEPPGHLPTEEHVTTLGEANFRGKRVRFGIREDDRRRHMYVIGKTGMGKSTLLENMIFTDIHAGKGLAVIDPHGDLAENTLKMVPKHRSNDVVLFDPTDRDYPISFNVLECKHPEQRSLIASGIMAIFTKMWPDMWSGRMEHIMRNTLLALIEAGGNSMLGIMRMFADDAFREKVVSHVSDPLVKSFWEDEFAGWSEKYRTEAVAAIQNKVGQLLSTPVIRNIVGQVQSSLDLRHAMDKGKIIIVNLSKGKLGEDNSAFMGSLLVTKFQIDAMSRADVEEHLRNDFYLYVDEFQNFATPSFATILSEARKYRLNLTMANQYVGQLTPDKSNTMLRDAVFGNVGTLVTFQVGSEDAEEIASQFGDEKLEEDIVGLPKYHAYMKLMIDGMTSLPFSVATLPPPAVNTDASRVHTIRSLSRERYSEQRSEVEEKIRKWAASAKQSRTKQKTQSKAKEKEIEEIKKAKKKGMKLAEYREWRDREMWTNEFNALLKEQKQHGITKENEQRLQELKVKIAAAGGATVEPNSDSQ